MPKTERKPEKQPQARFAEGLCFRKLFFIFIIGCIFGCVYETLLMFFMGLIFSGEPIWVSRSGLLYGQLNPVYGVGAVLMTLFLAEKNLKWWQIILLGSLIGGVFEYVIGIAQELFTGTSSWNYSGQWLNIGGKTSIPIMLVWGVICLLFINIIYPFCSKLIEKIPPTTGEIIFWTLLVLIIIDCALSFSAVIRMNLRRHNVPTFTPYGKFLDAVYTDERIHRSYTNMENV